MDLSRRWYECVVPDDLADAFVTASRALVGLSVRSIAAAPVDVTVAQFRVLVLLASLGEQSVGDLGEHLGVNQSNASRQCDRLEALGLVGRRRSTSDGRVVRVGLTGAGREAVDAVTDWRRGEVTRIVALMPQRHRAGVVAALRAFTDAAHELPDRDWPTAQW